MGIRVYKMLKIVNWVENYVITTMRSYATIQNHIKCNYNCLNFTKFVLKT